MRRSRVGFCEVGARASVGGRASGWRGRAVSVVAGVGSLALTAAAWAGSAQANLSLAAPVDATLAAVSCPSSQLCVAVGTTRPSVADGNAGQKPIGAVVTVASGRPGPVRPVGGPFFRLSGVSCVSAEVCWAVGSSDPMSANSAAVVAISRGVPSVPVAVPGATFLDGITCRAGQCVAVGAELLPGGGYRYDGVVALLEGSRTVAVHRVDQAQRLSAISCWTARDCEAVGVPQGVQAANVGVPAPASVVVVTAGGAPTTVSTVPVAGLDAISCPTSTCLAAGGDIIVPVASGKAGVAHPVVGASQLAGISCPTATDCVVAGASTNRTGTKTAGVMSRNVSWAPATQAQVVPGTTGMAAVDCRRPTTCEAVGDSGYTAVVLTPSYS